MSKILGKYNIYADVSALVNSYQFTNGDRNVELQATADGMLTFYCSDINRPVNRSVTFSKDNVLKIRRARIITDGAPGLQSNTSPAASVLLIAKNTNDVSADPLGGVMMSFANYNEWQDFNIDFLQSGATGSNFYFMLDHTYSKLNVDDYNIQDAYVGETFKATLQLEVDTAGLIDNGGNIV